jgi:hypothetical protein
MNSVAVKTMYFYKGTTFPLGTTEKGANQYKFSKDITKGSIEMIMAGLKDGISKEEQIKDYLERRMQFFSLMKFIGSANPNKIRS